MVIAVVEPEGAPSARLVANLVEVAVGDVVIGMPLEVSGRMPATESRSIDSAGRCGRAYVRCDR